MSSGDESESSRIQEDLDLPERKRKPGIIYLSSVPEGMSVGETTSFFAEFGAVGRLFLQPDQKLGMRHFTEGWIEFLSKKVAKRVAQQVNNTQVDGKRRHKPSYALWNIKYLPKFKWVHLSERLAYERAVKQQRMRTEISQVKRETEQFKGSVRVQKKKRKRELSQPEQNKEKGEERLFHFQQDQPESVIRKRKLEQPSEQEEGGGGGSRPKKSKKANKTKKEKVEEPVAVAPVKSKKVKKSTKKKKKKVSEEPRSTPVKSSKPHRKSAESAASHRKSPATKDDGGGGSRKPPTRRKSGEGGGDRAAFLKSVFGGGS